MSQTPEEKGGGRGWRTLFLSLCLEHPHLLSSQHTHTHTTKHTPFRYTLSQTILLSSHFQGRFDKLCGRWVSLACCRHVQSAPYTCTVIARILLARVQLYCVWPRVYPCLSIPRPIYLSVYHVVYPCNRFSSSTTTTKQKAPS